MAQTTTTYSPADLTVVFNGIILQGISDAGVKVTVENNMFEPIEGLDGVLDRVKTSKLRATVTVPLLQTSPSNDELGALFAADVELNTGKGPFFMKDSGGRELVTCLAAWIPKGPDLTWGVSATDREWTFVGAMNITYGGSGAR